MALPTLTKTWQFDVNQTVPYIAPGGAAEAEDMAQTWLYMWKESLIGFASNPWQVIYSSDGSSTGPSDLWTSPSAIKRDFAITDPRAWIVLRQPALGANFEILFDYAVYNAYNYSHGFILVCPTGFDTSGASTTSSPVPNGPSNPMSEVAYGDITFAINSPTTAQRLHVMMSDDGKITRWWSCHDGSFSSNFVQVSEVAGASVWTPGGYGHVYLPPNNGSYGTLNDSAHARSVYPGTHNDEFFMYMTSIGSIAALGQIQTVPDDDSGDYPVSAIGLASGTPATYGPRRGALDDIWWGSTAISSGDTYPASGSKDFVQLGDLVLPWNGTTMEMS